MRFHKIVLSVVLIFCIIINAAPMAWAGPQVTGKSGILIDGKSGQVLYTKDADEPLPPASTTKILTAVIALERTKLTDKVTAGKNPSLVEPSAIGFMEGETLTMENLLYSLLVKSANDAAVAIAEHISGSVPEFARLMNETAGELGATNSNFTNPHGLPDPNHYSTAHDLAVIARYAMKNPVFREIVATKVKTIPRENDSDIQWLETHNKLLKRYELANGIKTGYTKEARQCLVASASDGQREFIAVVLGSEGNNIWTDATVLLDYGFDNYATIKHKNANTLIKTVSVNKGTGNAVLVTAEDFYYTIPKGETRAITEEVELDDNISAPVKKGQVLGRVKFLESGKMIGSANLIAQNNIPAEEAIVRDGASFNPILAGGIILGLFTVWNIRRRRHKVRRKNKWRYKNAIR